MALLFVDSFDHYATADALTKWTSFGSGSIVAAAGRRASGAMRIGASGGPLNGLSPGSTTAIIGVAIKLGTLLPQNYVVVSATGTVQVSLTFNGSGFAQVWRGSSVGGGTLLGTASIGSVTLGTFVFVELKVVIHPSAGSVIVRINEAEVLNLPVVNTAASGVAAWDAVQLAGSLAANTDYDDLYVLDGSGSAPLNTFLGDCRVDARYPTGAGATTGWTPSTGANWAAVDDATPNGDTDYVSTATIPSTDTYAVQDAPVPGALLYGAQVCISARKTDAGTCTIVPVVRHAGTDNPGTAVNPPTTYTYLRQVYATNPGTGAAWLETDFNNAEFGIKRTA